MAPPLQHDYIGIGIGIAESDTGSSSSVSSASDLKTELRLGLPGSESPERRVNGSQPSLILSISTAARGFGSGSKRGFSDAMFSTKPVNAGSAPEPAAEPIRNGEDSKKKQDPNPSPAPPAAKAQVVGWPPVRNYRKNTMSTIANPSKKKEDAEAKQGPGCVYVKVSMDGAPYLRKTDLKMYSNYKELSLALEKMFSCFTIGQCGSHGMPTRDGQTENKLTDNGSENVLTYEDKDGDWMLVGDVPWEMFTETCRRLRIMKASDAIGLAPRAAGKVKNQN